MYMGLAAIGILVFVSVTDEGLARFFGPVKRLLLAQGAARVLVKYPVMTGLAALVGFMVLSANRATLEPPSELRTIHPTLPGQYDNKPNPLPWTKDNIRKGRELYVANCSWCHGDRADGKGLFAGGFNPEPIDLSAAGTIDMLTEGYLFWRIKEGGIGLPTESNPYASAMPPWNPSQKHMGLGISEKMRLSDNDIWLVIMGAYDIAGRKPRSVEQHD
jgi:hypothetical protein